MRTAVVCLCLALGAGLILPRELMAQGPPASPASPASTRTVSADGRSATVSVTRPGGPPSAASRVIVRFRAGQSFLPGSGRSQRLSASANIHRVDNPPGLSVSQVIGRYKAMPNVVYAEPDYEVNAILTPNDPSFPASQWDMTKIAAQAAWDLHTDSSDIVVAVIDTGIDFTHPDLQANLYSDAATPTIHGYTCMNGSCVPGGQDDHGHGTHVAGTIGAATNNGIGMAGINWHVKLLALKFLNSGGSGDISDAVLAFDLIRSLKQAGVNIRVSNNSWGGGGYSQALKDAMAAIEAPTIATGGTVVGGTLNVCAAGNSGVNADFSPMWPGAYDNRGILSVLATDSSDVGAGFTNFGLASVDLAAPGVNTFSTSPTGTCALCDPSGYKLLSGTSMASPHVAGVAAALLSMRPLLTAAEARDALLHPNSYDWMTNAKAQSTSSGGRLNFLKTITNPFINAPILNNFPTVTVGPDVFTSGGGTVSFTATTSDPDNDALRTSAGRGAASAGATWLFGWELSQLFPATFPFNAPFLARTAAMSYDTSVADNRGGGASGRNWVVVSPVASPGGPPAGTLTVPATGSVNVPVTIGFNPIDPDGQAVAWDFWASGNGGSSGSCCFGGSSMSATFNSAGVYRISVQAIDRELNTSVSQTAVISIGGATGVPPIAAATLDKQSGPAPLTVNVNMSASTDPDGVISFYFIDCGTGFATGTQSPTGSCTFDSPGTYWLLLQVRDNLGYMGLVSKYVVVTPVDGGAPPPSDTTAPTVSITNPTSGAVVSGVVNLQATATDNAGGSGVKEVEYYLDSTAAGASLGKVAAPFTLSWNTAGLSPGTHTIYAIARDHATNASAPVSVGVTVNVKAPAVSLSPSGSTTVKKKASLQMTASITNTPTYPTQRVDFLVGGVVACSDTTAPYACAWKAPAATRNYQAEARAYDNRGNVGVSNTLTIVVK